MIKTIHKLGGMSLHCQRCQRRVARWWGAGHWNTDWLAALCLFASLSNTSPPPFILLREGGCLHFCPNGSIPSWLVDEARWVNFLSSSNNLFPRACVRKLPPVPCREERQRFRQRLMNINCRDMLPESPSEGSAPPSSPAALCYSDLKSAKR